MKKIQTSARCTPGQPFSTVPSVLFTAAMLCGLVLAGCAEQDRRFTDRDMDYTLARWHGVGSLHDSVRSRIIRDTALIQRYADLLEGRADSSVKGDTATVLWWLAESGNPKYIPTFLKYADPDLPMGVLQMGVYGLARHASVPAAGQRLRELAATTDAERRYMTAHLLMFINDDAARTILREIPADGAPRLAPQRDSLLATTPLPPGQGRWPCLDGQEYDVAPDGVFRCVESVAQRR